MCEGVERVWNFCCVLKFESFIWGPKQLIGIGLPQGNPSNTWAKSHTLTAAQPGWLVYYCAFQKGSTFCNTNLIPCGLNFFKYLWRVYLDELFLSCQSVSCSADVHRTAEGARRAGDAQNPRQETGDVLSPAPECRRQLEWQEDRPTGLHTSSGCFWEVPRTSPRCQRTQDRIMGRKRSVTWKILGKTAIGFSNESSGNVFLKREYIVSNLRSTNL